MNRARSCAVLLATLTATLTTACAKKVIPPAAPVAPQRPAKTLVVLLPDADKTTGRARVSNPLGSVDLGAERDATIATTTSRPGVVTTLSAADVDRLFGEALAALPPPPRHYTLNFLFESDELTDDSRGLVSDILQAVKDHPVPEVVIVGHTDTMGRSATNAALGMKRATTVRNLLVRAGLNRSTIQVRSHGEADLLVKTADETPEPRNRRVEISVR